ncbi:hypothetical protein [Bradyrhizobium sp. 141]|uniref:leucine-rich repeat domain-containing protein n=1 Tax=Bradyrhizobium sp. 141 TaxID=2782617 RepID=UPI001FF77DEF|nr:hypothetical protein [Bradyrhizobium sp. 141]MCK1717282.1 hypothetical protein [Bradyrhizobium sp. 141]
MSAVDSDTAQISQNADYLLVCERVNRARDRNAKCLSLSTYAALNKLPDLNGLDSLSQFTVYGSSLRSVAPLAQLKNLRRLFIVSSQLVDLSGLEQLRSLTQLYLWGNPDLNDLSALRPLTRLRTLVLRSTSVVDLSPIQDLKSLTELNLQATSVADLGPLQSLRNLRTLRLSNTPVADISILSNFKWLENLAIDDTRVESIEVLRDCEYLRSIDISKTPISDLSPLAGVQSLVRVAAAGAGVEDLSPLATISDIREINVNDTKVSDISALASLEQLRGLYVERTLVKDLSPISHYEVMFRRTEYYGGVSFKGSPIADSIILSFSDLKPSDRTRRVINYLRTQQSLVPYEIVADENAQRDPLSPVPDVSSPFLFELSSSGKVALQNRSASEPIFPQRSSEAQFKQRLDASRTLASDLISELSSRNRIQARAEYLEGLRRYVERLPRSKDDGNILLADAEARTIRNLFASEVDTLASPFASKLKTFLEHHIGLRVYYPELTAFYRDVQTGRINEPLSLDAIEGFVQVVRESTPDVFDTSVDDAIDGAAEPPVEAPSEKHGTSPLSQNQVVPPPDPLGEVNPDKAHDYTFAGTANSLWKVFVEGERINRGIEGWGKAGTALRPYVTEILDWLHRFTSAGN